MKQVRSFFAEMGRIFMPPFDGLPLILWCYFVFSYLAVPHNPLWHGDLPDADDYTYLTQTLDWLHGQNWYDNIQHRMMPPEGTPIHYTRFAELPIAALILLFRACHYTWHGSAILASYLLPILYLGVLFCVLRWTISRLVPHNWARLGCFIAFCGPGLMAKFSPGQVDHHGLEAILTLLATGCILQMFEQPGYLRWPLLAGCIFALALAIALETLPWMMLASAVIGLWVLLVGGRGARAGAIFALSLFTGAALLLVCDRPPQNLFTQDLLAYSIAYVWLTGGIALALLAASGIAYIQKPKLRICLGAIVALGIGGVYLHAYPALLGGPYGAMDERLASLFFANLEEALPMTQRYNFYNILLCSATGLIAFISAVFFWKQESGGKKYGWLLIAALTGTSLIFALFYQIRVLIYALAFAPIALTEFARRAWEWIAAHAKGREQFWAEIALALVIGPLFAILLPAIQDGRSFGGGVLLFPAQGFDDICSLRDAEGVLNQLPRSRIMNLIDTGPDILFNTPHSIMSAPYHTNVRGNLDALDFFAATDMAKAHDIARRDKIDLVLLCRQVPDMYLAGPGPHYVQFPTGEIRIKDDPSLAGQLALRQTPDWLHEIPLPPSSNFVLFSVK